VTAVITALTGLIGVLVGVLLASLLQRRNWQRQELMKSYAALFPLGEDALRLANTVELEVGNASPAILDAVRSQKGDPTAYKSDERAVQLRESAHLLYEEFHRQADPELRKVLLQCWLLERDREIRTHIERFQERYLAVKVGLRRRFNNMEIDWLSGGARSHERQQRMEAKPHVDELFEELKEMREQVADRHFHGGSQPSGVPRRRD